MGLGFELGNKLGFCKKKTQEINFPRAARWVAGSVGESGNKAISASWSSSWIELGKNCYSSKNDKVNIQGVPQNTFRFNFLNFSASYESRNFILDIFQQPYPCRFKKYPVFYYLIKSGPRYCQNSERQSF